MAKKNKAPKNTLMAQINGQTGATEALLHGGERIFSQEDTRQIHKMVLEGDTRALGRFVYSAIKKQDATPAQYADE